jgi:hypothetical protein
MNSRGGTLTTNGHLTADISDLAAFGRQRATPESPAARIEMLSRDQHRDLLCRRRRAARHKSGYADLARTPRPPCAFVSPTVSGQRSPVSLSAWAALTRKGYTTVSAARPFFGCRLSPDGRLDRDSLDAAAVTTSVAARTPSQSRCAAKLAVTALRCLLGFMDVEGLIARRLTEAVPAVTSGGKGQHGRAMLIPDTVFWCVHSGDRAIGFSLAILVQTYGGTGPDAVSSR